MIDVKSIDIFRDSICTLKDTSRDNHDGEDFYMTNSELSVYNFDRVKDIYVKDLSVPEAPKSCDAFFDYNGQMYLIEFRNGEIKDVWRKLYDSLLILMDILKINIEKTRQLLSFILVYNETRYPKKEDEKNEMQNSQSRDKIVDQVSKKAGENFPLFGLKRFEKLYFKNVFTVTEDEFDNSYVRNWRESVL